MREEELSELGIVAEAQGVGRSIDTTNATLQGHETASEIWRLVDRAQQRFLDLSDRIWNTPELSFEEFRAADLYRHSLEEAGFKVKVGLAGLPTSLLGEWGTGGPVVALLGEYDALPGLSQQAGIAVRQPDGPSEAGHGCGHNLLGAASLAAAVALKEWLEASGIPGCVRFYGCPAEEASAGKTFMVRAGVFDDVDTAITWHPWTITRVTCEPSFAMTSIDFTFSGQAAHAAAEPHLGRSALDAAELMNVGVNFLREHVKPSSRLHYAFLDSGGSAPNVVQSKAVLRYGIRAPELDDMLDLVERVKRVAQGAAIMTDTTVVGSINHAVSPLLVNETLAAAMHTKVVELGPIRYDPEDVTFATEIQNTLASGQVDADFTRHGIAPRAGVPLCDFLLDFPSCDRAAGGGATDVGDVSWMAPLVQLYCATMALGTPLHTWQTVAQGKSGVAHKGLLHAAKIMAATGAEILLDPDLLLRARGEHRQRLAWTPYVCPIPPSVHPPSTRQSW